MNENHQSDAENKCAKCGAAFHVPPSHRSKRVYCSRQCRAAAQSEWQRKDLSERFWAKVQETETCWTWTAALLKTGYGSIRVDGKAMRAHRVAYELAKGPIPEGALLRHTCDNPKCVNPDHLIPGTKSDNTKDAIERGQHAVGELHRNAKVSNQAVTAIRAALAAGVPGKFLAKQFGVDQTLISQIKLNKKRVRG